MKLAFWRKSSPDDEKRVAEATTPASNSLAKVLRRFTAPEPDWREIEEALLASDVGLVATTALTAALGLPAWSAMTGPSQGAAASALTLLPGMGEEARPLILVDDEADDDDDDGGSVARRTSGGDEEVDDDDCDDGGCGGEGEGDENDDDGDDCDDRR